MTSSNSMLAAKVLRNISKWTRDLQQCIGLALKVRDEGMLNTITREPMQYFCFLNGHEVDWATDPYVKYKTLSKWKNAIPLLMSSLSTTDNTDLLVEVIGTLNHLTCYDLPTSTSWEDIITDYSLVELMRNTIATGELSVDVYLEVIIFCSVLCESRSSANLLVGSTLINELLVVWEEVGGDAEIHLQILNLCEKLLSFEETRSTFLLGTGTSPSYSLTAHAHYLVLLLHSSSLSSLKMQCSTSLTRRIIKMFQLCGVREGNFTTFIINRTWPYSLCTLPLMYFLQIASRCLNALADFHTCNDDDMEERFSTIAKEKRFSSYNSMWLQKISWGGMS